MRSIPVLLSVPALALITGAVFADPANVEPKSWHVHLDPSRVTYPEQEPNDTCGDGAQQVALNDVVNPAMLDPGDADWYSLTMYFGHAAMFGTDAVNPGDDTDTYIELYADDCSTVLAQDDDSGPGFYSLIDHFVVPYTGTYYLKVRGYDSGTAGPYQAFFAWVDIPPPPPNDACGGAIEIPTCAIGSMGATMDGATNDYDPGIPGPSCTGYPAAGKDMVYRIDAARGDVMDFTYRQQNADASFYIVTDCADVSGSCVAGADETSSGEPESIHYVAAASATYYLILDSYGTDSGGPWTLDFSISWSLLEACCFPDLHCEVLCSPECAGEGGTPMGGGTNCETVVCENPTAARVTTWGRIKSAYR